MILAPLSRHLAVCSLAEVHGFLAFDPDFWNVISIGDTTRARARFTRAKSIKHWWFDDAGAAAPGSGIVMSPDQAADIWRFVDSTGEEPLLIHCFAGLSRSTAVAAAIIARSLLQSGVQKADLGREIANRLLQIRPPAYPNGHVVQCMLRHHLPEPDARQIAAAIWEDDRIMENRFVRPH